ncbi:MAG: hypothetical protein WDA75_16920 [Candidatus Latescibacterota bacterium]|jgi:hypothetical protein
MTEQNSLRVRLFGYGAPYQVRFDQTGTVVPLVTTAEAEAAALVLELTALTGRSAGLASTEPGGWALSMPFGRCGVAGLPREYLIPWHCREAYLDLLDPDGYRSVPLSEGAVVQVVPGRVIRFRGRPRPGRRVLVSFQTEDRTPLLGNAAPFTLDGQVPEAYNERLVRCHGAFAAMRRLAETDPPAYRRTLEGFFSAMAARLAGNPEVARTQAEAREQGTYLDQDQLPLFGRQRNLLTESVIQRLAQQEEGLFRFPGMFGAVASLGKLID